MSSSALVQRSQSSERQLGDSEAEAGRLAELGEEHRAHVEALTSTRSYRMLAPLRAVRRAFPLNRNNFWT